MKEFDEWLKSEDLKQIFGAQYKHCSARGPQLEWATINVKFIKTNHHGIAESAAVMYQRIALKRDQISLKSNETFANFFR